MRLILSIAIMQRPTSVAIMDVLKFCCNYVRGTCCYNYVGGSFCCNDTGDCFCCHLQLEVSAAFMQVKVFPANKWVRSFIEIMQVESAAIMQVAFSAVHFAHDYSIVIMQVTYPCAAKEFRPKLKRCQSLLFQWFLCRISAQIFFIFYGYIPANLFFPN